MILLNVFWDPYEILFHSIVRTNTNKHLLQFNACVCILQCIYCWCMNDMIISICVRVLLFLLRMRVGVCECVCVTTLTALDNYERYDSIWLNYETIFNRPTKTNIVNRCSSFILLSWFKKNTNYLDVLHRLIQSYLFISFRTVLFFFLEYSNRQKLKILKKNIKINLIQEKPAKNSNVNFDLAFLN